MKRYISKYLVVILTLVMILTPALAVYADGDTEGEESGPAVKELTAVSGVAAEEAAELETAGDRAVAEEPAAETFTVKWMLQDDDEEPVETDEGVESGTAPSYDGEEPVREADDDFTYEFIGWADEPGQDTGVTAEELPAVTEDAVYYAVFRAVPVETPDESEPEGAEEPDGENGGENTAEEQPEEAGQESAPAAPAEESVPLRAPAATYFTVTFTDGLGKTLKTQRVESGKAATAPAAPTRKGYDFKGWDKIFSNVTSNLTVNAKWDTHVHKYGAWTVTVQPNYFKTGSRTRKCSCGQTQTETMPKLVAKNRWIGYGGKLYYFDGNGKVYRGWHKMVPIKSTREQWCYFNRNTGAFVKGIVNTTKNKWVEADGYRFYFYYAMRPIGAGWQVINGRVYYMDNWDAAMTGTFKAKDGKTYKANSDGTIWGMPYYIHKYKTFILIDKSDQTLYYYEDMQFNMAAGVVTGLKGVYDTPRGTYYLRNKLRNIYLTGPTWRSYVNYWMAFIGSSYGIHDATWRSGWEFDDRDVYKYDGSHGCVNMSLSEASKLYYRVSIGTTVIVQE
ncbi:MAG: L,D-transpeptidase family protein [Mogibacterium sp.]|nr:L,D-transpeptidase family protein [Mogibacterium sp.]